MENILRVVRSVLDILYDTNLFELELNVSYRFELNKKHTFGTGDKKNEPNDPIPTPHKASEGAQFLASFWDIRLIPHTMSLLTRRYGAAGLTLFVFLLIISDYLLIFFN